MTGNYFNLMEARTSLPEVVFKKADYERIADLADALPRRLFHVSTLLLQELARARIVDSPDEDIVRMHSTVLYKLEGVRKFQTATLVYPHEADVERNRIPVTSLLGAALIGLAKGATMHWQDKDGGSHALVVGSVRQRKAALS